MRSKQAEMVRRIRGDRRDRRDRRHSPRGGFTLTELLVVVGLIAVLMSMLMPALGKVRAAAGAASCLSNLRQMGQAWTMYTVEHKGRVMEYMWDTRPRPDIAWQGYWLGVLEGYQVQGDVLLCPAASEPVPFNRNRGFGTVWHAWSGRFTAAATPLRFNNTIHRDSSYGYNRYMTAGGGFGRELTDTKLTTIRPLSEVPLFMDAVWVDFQPFNGSAAMPVQPPPDLHGGDLPASGNEHWRFLIARHKRGINVGMADGSVRWTPLEEMYTLKWKSDWVKYRLSLPSY